MPFSTTSKTTLIPPGDVNDATGKRLAAPFPYFGGKSRAAPMILPRYGQAGNYVEPFCGSLAMLLAQPAGRRVETVNDTNGFIVNFWRSIQAEPERVAQWSDWPVAELDLEARHAWLVNRTERLRWCLQDPDYHDPKIAGWWVWGACIWIGSGWCLGDGPWVSNGVELFDRRKGLNPGDAEIGIKRSLPHLGNAGMGLNRRLPAIGDPGRRKYILKWFKSLSRRIRDVRITCGDWERVLTDSVTVRHGVTAVFLDPPYRAPCVAKGLYAQEGDASQGVDAWCLANGDNPKLRVALCGYAGEHVLPGWTEVVGKATNGGYGSAAGNTNHRRERIWFSPHCVGGSNV